MLKRNVFASRGPLLDKDDPLFAFKVEDLQLAGISEAVAVQPWRRELFYMIGRQSWSPYVSTFKLFERRLGHASIQIELVPGGHRCRFEEGIFMMLP